jgi:predicted Fe-Mo cluster-binding NifX family protein
VWLAKEGVSAVLVGSMGSRAQARFQENHIDVIVGVMESNPEKAVLNYLSGSLTKCGNVCDYRQKEMAN